MRVCSTSISEDFYIQGGDTYNPDNVNILRYVTLRGFVVISGECFASGNSYHTHSKPKVIFCILVGLFRSSSKSKVFDLGK
jgi:hypothetical protein